MTNRRVLIVAYHYPPSHGSSGIQRTLQYSKYLREFGWEPMILTVSPRAHEQVSDGQIGEIPAGMPLRRAFGLDTARHLAFRGRYFGWMAQPDRWVSWWPMGVAAGMSMIRRYRPAAIMSTYPIATAHLIGRSLQRLSGLPWVADFRDAMTEPEYPRDPETWKIHRRIEGQVVQRCARAVFTTQGTLAMYAARYPEVPKERWTVIENGFDEGSFADAERDLISRPIGSPGQLILLHSGILYPEERDPRPLFTALRQLKDDGVIRASLFRLILRATGSDERYRLMIAQYGIEDIVAIEASIDYRAALQEMLRADGLLLMQAAICNHQIPAKLYEYARAGRPILGLTDFGGNTAALLDQLGCKHVANIADAGSIRHVMQAFIEAWKSGALKGTAPDLAARCSRKFRTRELSVLLDNLC